MRLRLLFTLAVSPMVVSAAAVAILIIVPLGSIPAAENGLRATLDERDAIHDYAVAIKQDTLRALLGIEPDALMMASEAALERWNQAVADPTIPAGNRQAATAATTAHEILEQALLSNDPAIVGPAFDIVLGSAEAGLQGSNALIDRRLGQVAFGAPPFSGITAMVDDGRDILDVDRIMAQHARAVGQLGVALAVADSRADPAVELAIFEATESTRTLATLDTPSTAALAVLGARVIDTARALNDTGSLGSEGLLRFWPVFNAALLATDLARDENRMDLTDVLDRVSTRAITAATIAGGGALALAAAAPVAILLLRRRVLRPVLALHAAAESTLDDEAAGLRVTANDELGDLTTSFQAMALRIRQQHQQLQAALVASNESRDALQESVAKLSEADLLRQHILNTASHELRTPLTPMRIQLNLLAGEKQGPLTDNQRRSLATLDSNLARLIGVINEMAQMHDLQTGQVKLHMTTVDVGGVAQSACRAAQAAMEEAGLTLVFQGDQPAIGHADAGKLQQVIDILLDNSRRYTAPGGHVTVTARPGPIIEVADDGRGMDAEEVQHLFTPFVRGAGEADKHGGAGLGLAIARALMEQMGGTITGESLGPDRGSTFRLTLQEPSL